MKKFTPSYWKKSLMKSIDMVMDHKDIYIKNPDTSFSRTQKISLRDSMLFPMLADNETTPVELQDYFKPENLPSPAAMSYRRDQLKVSAFKAVFEDFTSKIPCEKTFHGLRVIACDGTRINTPYNPKDKNSYVDHIEGRKGFNQYHLTTCYDVLNGVFTDAVIQNYHSMNEKIALCEMMERTTSNSMLFVADRGFASYGIVAHSVKTGHKFLVRLTSLMAQNIFCDTVDLNDMDVCDVEDIFYIGRVRNKDSKKLKNYHFIRKTQRYDYIEAGCQRIDSFRVRLVKFMLPSGNTEYLLTNLPKNTFSLEDLKELYRLRWEIETSFRYLKYASGMVHMHSIKPRFIFQEIFAKLTLYNFSAGVLNSTHIQQRKGLKHKYTVDKTYLIKSCIRFLEGRLNDILSVIQKRRVPVRPERSFEKNVRRQHADTLQYR